eukprot:365162-Chlamydomonas_euryale.AAC.15
MAAQEGSAPATDLLGEAVLCHLKCSPLALFDMHLPEEDHDSASTDAGVSSGCDVKTPVRALA